MRKRNKLWKKLRGTGGESVIGRGMWKRRRGVARLKWEGKKRMKMGSGELQGEEGGNLGKGRNSRIKYKQVI